MRALVVDDEPLARARLRRLLEQLSDCEVVAEAGDGEQAVAFCSRFLPDVVLMDIRMPVMDGLSAARAIADMAQPPAVIFCTAYNDYALEAFEAEAVGYLLKPVNRDKLSVALDKAQKLNKVQLSALAESAQEQGLRSHISAKTSRGIELVSLAEVRYFLAEQKYVSAVYTAGELLIDDSLKDLEEEFGERLLRVHRNALVVVEHILGLERLDQGYRIKLAGIEQGPLVSRRHMSELRKLLKEL